ncbi:hypothetical protein GCM10009555_084260 [Acrocarpospora macrocephala]|uniref:Uncharacterized protein n=1 Tax=Acrocarpospora macrocephala TaxID=150177 RepID=A0A5M3X1S5_9ACTN|nr:hypothetical protein Amac_071380 [Acrocarpospora macrocephala]
MLAAPLPARRDMFAAAGVGAIHRAGARQLRHMTTASGGEIQSRWRLHPGYRRGRLREVAMYYDEMSF